MAKSKKRAIKVYVSEGDYEFAQKASMFYDKSMSEILYDFFWKYIEMNDDEFKVMEMELPKSLN